MLIEIIFLCVFSYALWKGMAWHILSPNEEGMPYVLIRHGVVHTQGRCSQGKEAWCAN